MDFTSEGVRLTEGNWLAQGHAAYKSNMHSQVFQLHSLHSDIHHHIYEDGQGGERAEGRVR